MLPFDDRDGFIWMDGSICPWRDAKLHILTHGLHYGGAVFEGLRVYNGNIFKLHEHSVRLINSAKLIGFTIVQTADEIDAICKKIIVTNNVKDGYIRPIAWRGSEMIAIAAQQTTIHLSVATWEWPALFSKEAYEKGICLQISKWKRPSPETEPTAAKAAGLYMICTMSKHNAMDAGFEDALMLDYRGYIAEATGANIFLIKNGEIHTPIPDCILDGITRRTVIELANKRGHKVIERHIKPEELSDMEEIFLTGTAAEITPVGQIAEYKFTIGKITKQLTEDYCNLVRN